MEQPNDHTIMDTPIQAPHINFGETPPIGLVLLNNFSTLAGDHG